MVALKNWYGLGRYFTETLKAWRQAYENPRSIHGNEVLADSIDFSSGVGFEVENRIGAEGLQRQQSTRYFCRGSKGFLASLPLQTAFIDVQSKSNVLYYPEGFELRPRDAAGGNIEDKAIQLLSVTLLSNGNWILTKKWISPCWDIELGSRENSRAQGRQRSTKSSSRVGVFDSANSTTLYLLKKHEEEYLVTVLGRKSQLIVRSCSFQNFLVHQEQEIYTSLGMRLIDEIILRFCAEKN